MRFYDISLPLRKGMAVWPGDSGFERKELRGTGIVSRLNLSTHTGTHIDAPRHFLFNNGSVDRIAISKLVGKARVVNVQPKGKLISVEDISKFRVKAHDKILFKTGNSRLYRKKKFDPNYISLSLSAAKYLAEKKIDVVGIDYYGIEAKSAPGHPVHKTLLRAGIVIVEGINLESIKPGKYNLAVLPLKIIGADGSPARAILWK